MEDNEEVEYCEWLAMCDPVQMKIEYGVAKKRYYAKLEAMKGYLFSATCFIGIRDLSGKWIITNEE